MNRKVFYDVVRSRFGPLDQSQVNGFERFLDFFEAVPGLLINQAAYALATVWHETGATMQPISEIGSRAYFDARYDRFKATTVARRSRAARMGNVNPGDGFKYRGRGYAQLTWANNYKKMGQKLGVDLYDNPELANDPEISIKVLWSGMQDGDFTGKKFSDYLNAHRTNYFYARRIVNGLDDANLIAGYAQVFEKALKSAI